MKWFKKNRFNIFTYLFCAFAMALFTIVSFSCKTYAYSIDNNGNLVGDNILDITNYEIIEQNNTTINVIDNTMTITATTDNTYSFVFLKFTNTIFQTNMNYTISFYGSTTNTNNYNQVNFKYRNTGSLENYYYYRQYISSSDLILYQHTFNTEDNTELYLLIYVNADLGGANTITLSNIMINKGNYKEWEPYGVWYSEQNYNELENENQSIQNQYNDLINTNNYGYWKYIDYVEFYESNTNIFVPNTDEQNEWSMNDLINYNILKIGGYFDTFPLTIEPYQSNYNEVETYINFKAYTPSESFLVSFNSCNGCNVIIYDNNSNSFSYTITETDYLIDINLIRENVPNFDLYIIDMKISPNNAEQNGIYFANNNYIEAYNKGYNASTRIANIEINNLKNQLDIANTQLTNLQQSVDTLQIAYNDLNTSYQNMLNGNNFANLFFTIAETPFASFKQIWSVDFLGVNLAGFVTGILFIGVLIWVVKKIF